MSHPIMSLQGGNAWALGQDGNGGVRGTTVPGDRQAGNLFLPYRCADGVWVQLTGMEMPRHLPKILKATGLTEQALFPKGVRGWQGANLNA